MSDAFQDYAQPESSPEQIEHSIRALDWRDLQLWWIGLAALVCVLFGFLVLVTPEVIWHFSAGAVRDDNVGRLVYGLVTLLVLLNVYLFQQRRLLLRNRNELILRVQSAERRAYTDALTGVYNRCFMEQAIEREMKRAKRNQTNLCLMLADVDSFKEFNTKFGHVVGDRILIEVAVLLQKNFRAADLVIRYGGDEFLVVMPETNLAEAGVAVDRLQTLLARWNGKEHREYWLHLSCGIAAYGADLNVEELIHSADADLYVRKAAAKADRIANASL